jgi:hypothetical protein
MLPVLQGTKYVTDELGFLALVIHVTLLYLILNDALNMENIM